MSLKRGMSSPSDIILLLQDANDIPSIRAALLAATPFSTDATVRVEVQSAEQRLERLVRLAKLTPPMMSAPLTPVRQQSHRQRMHLLMESRLKKVLISMGNNIIDLSATERLMKDACHDDRCGDCSQSAEYQSVCLQFALECLAIRMSTRLRFDAANGFAIPVPTREFMEAFVADPVRAWLDHSQRLYSLGTELDAAYDTAVLPTDDGTKARRKEVKEYRLHVDSLKKMILNLQACDTADAN